MEAPHPALRATFSPLSRGEGRAAVAEGRVRGANRHCPPPATFTFNCPRCSRSCFAVSIGIRTRPCC